MHIETARSHQTLKDGTERVYQRHLLRRSYRQGGKVRKQTLANLSHLPDEAIAALRLVLGGKTVVDADAALQVERSAGHGHVAAVHTIARQLGLPALLGPAGRARPPVGCSRRWSGWWAARTASMPSWPAAACKPAASPCSTCPARGWRARTVSWPALGIPATASAASSRSSTGCCATPLAGRWRCGCLRATPPTRRRSPRPWRWCAAASTCGG